MLCTCRGVRATRRRESSEQAGWAKLVTVVRGVLVRHVLLHDRVVQTVCFARRTFRALWVPVIMGTLSLSQRELSLKCALRFFLKHATFSSSSSEPPSHEGSRPGRPCSAAEVAPLFLAISSRCTWQGRTQEIKLFGSLRSLHSTDSIVEAVLIWKSEGHMLHNCAKTEPSSRARAESTAESRERH